MSASTLRVGETTPNMSLADPHALYSICFWFFESLVDIRAEAEKEGLPAEQAAEKTTELAQTLFFILQGQVDGFTPDPDWTGKPMQEWLLHYFSSDIAKLADKERAQIGTPQAIVMFAISRFMQELLEAMERTTRHSDDQTQPDAHTFHLICKKWAALFLGKPNE